MLIEGIMEGILLSISSLLPLISKIPSLETIVLQGECWRSMPGAEAFWWWIG